MNRKQQIIQSAIEANIINNDLTAIGIMDLDSLKKTILAVQQAFPQNFFHTFAVKANALLSVLASIKDNGMGAEVASPGELLIALEAGFNTEHIIFDSPAKTISDLRQCLAKDISINIDNIQELERLDKLMLEYPQTKSVIGFRVNPQIGSGVISSTSTATATSKFGYALADNNNRQTLIDIYKARPWLTSIHTHTGSQGCELTLMAKGVSALTELAEEINDNIAGQQVVRLDIGGGLPVNFASEEVNPTFTEYAELLNEHAPILFTNKYQVKTEFGRAIVAKNGVIVTRVEYTKTAGTRHIAITHAGAQILTRTAFLPKAWPLRITGFTPLGKEKTAQVAEPVMTDVAGPCCFAGDLVCVNQLLPKLAIDDYVMVHDTGGYYFSNHFDYNSLPRVGVFAVSGENQNLNIKCIRKADSIEDVLSKM